MELKTKVKAEAGSQEIFITRHFDLPVHLVFKAYTEAQLLEQWMNTKVIRHENKKHGSRSVTYFDLWIFIGGQCGGNSDCAADRGKSACVYKR